MTQKYNTDEYQRKKKYFQNQKSRQKLAEQRQGELRNSMQVVEVEGFFRLPKKLTQGVRLPPEVVADVKNAIVTNMILHNISASKSAEIVGISAFCLSRWRADDAEFAALISRAQDAQAHIRVDVAEDVTLDLARNAADDAVRLNAAKHILRHRVAQDRGWTQSTINNTVTVHDARIIEAVAVMPPTVEAEADNA